MTLWMKKRANESQRKNGLNDLAFEKSCEKPVEHQQFNYNTKSWPPVMAMRNEMECISMANLNNQKLQQKSTNLERIQQNAMESKKESKHQPNMPQSNVINSNTPGWTVSDDNKNISVTADRGDSNVMTLPQGAYYEEPIYIDPITYQQQQANSFNVAVPVDLQQNLAQPYRCANADCVNCKKAS